MLFRSKLICRLKVINMQRQVEELSHQLIEMKKRILEDREKSSHRNMTNFENLFHGHKQRRELLYQVDYDIETKKIYDSNSCVDWNQPPKFDEEEAQDVTKLAGC